jgi:hypothetical protein
LTQDVFPSTQDVGEPETKLIADTRSEIVWIKGEIERRKTAEQEATVAYEQIDQTIKQRQRAKAKVAKSADERRNQAKTKMTDAAAGREQAERRLVDLTGRLLNAESALRRRREQAEKRRVWNSLSPKQQEDYLAELDRRRDVLAKEGAALRKEVERLTDQLIELSYKERDSGARKRAEWLQQTLLRERLEGPPYLEAGQMLATFGQGFVRTDSIGTLDLLRLCFENRLKSYQELGAELPYPTATPPP